MVLFNHSTRELTAKIVYYGPGLGGKTTNLRLLHERLEKGTAGRLLSLATAQDRTIYFDLLPVELGNIKGYTVRFQLCTVPGQVFYNETRKLVLRGVDGLVFVVDSQPGMLSHNLESFQNLRDNLREAAIALETLPLVIQYNKRDLPGVLSIEDLQDSLAFQAYPFTEGVASTGKGVVETFKLVSKLTFVDLLRRLQKSGNLPDAATESARDPGEETLIRSRRAERAALAASIQQAPPPPPIPSIPPDRMETTESPFEMSASWPAGPLEDVFAEPAPVEPSPLREVPKTQAPISQPTIPISSQFLKAPMPVANVELPPLPRAIPAALMEAMPAPPPPADRSGPPAAWNTPPAPAFAPKPVRAPAPAPATPIAAIAPTATIAAKPGRDLAGELDDLRHEISALGDRIDAMSGRTPSRDALDALSATLEIQGDSSRQELESIREAISGLRLELVSTLPSQADVASVASAAAEAAHGAVEKSHAVHGAMEAAHSALRAEIENRQGSLRSEIESRDTGLRGEIESLKGSLRDLEGAVAALRYEMASLREGGETRRKEAAASAAGLGDALSALRRDLSAEIENGRGSLRAELETLAAALARGESERHETHQTFAARAGSFDEAIKRLGSEREADRQRADERLSAAERKSRALADALRQAIANLGE